MVCRFELVLLDFVLFFSPALVRVEAGNSSLPAPRSCHLQTTPDKGVVGDDGDDGDDDGGDDNGNAVGGDAYDDDMVTKNI